MLNNVRTFKATVSRVVDGDTFHCEPVVFDYIEFQVVLKDPIIRINLVDTPERGEAGYSEATEFTKEHLEGKEVTIEVLEKDDWDRYVSNVYLEDGTDYGQELLSEHLAVIYKP